MKSFLKTQAPLNAPDNSLIRDQRPKDRRQGLSVTIPSSGRALLPRTQASWEPTDSERFLENCPPPSFFCESPPLPPNAAQLSLTLRSESPTELKSFLWLHDSDTVPGSKVNFLPEPSPSLTPEPLSSSDSDSEDQNGDDNEMDNGDDVIPEMGVESVEPSSPDDSRGCSSHSPSSPTPSSDPSSATSDTFNPSACGSPSCGVDIPHDIGLYLHADGPPTLYFRCEKYPWGFSLPPPNVYVAHWLTSLTGPTDWRDYSIFRGALHESSETYMERENRDLVANFMAHHGWWGETLDEEMENFETWDEYQHWGQFCTWRERRRAGLPWPVSPEDKAEMS